MKNCKLQGDVFYRKLLIEDGAQFEGKCDIVKKENNSEFKFEYFVKSQDKNGFDFFQSLAYLQRQLNIHISLFSVIWPHYFYFTFFIYWVVY